jgi:hypothetical protein
MKHWQDIQDASNMSGHDYEIWVHIPNNAAVEVPSNSPHVTQNSLAARILQW